MMIHDELLYDPKRDVICFVGETGKWVDDHGGDAYLDSLECFGMPYYTASYVDDAVAYTYRKTDEKGEYLYVVWKDGDIESFHRFSDNAF